MDLQTDGTIGTAQVGGMRFSETGGCECVSRCWFSSKRWGCESCNECMNRRFGAPKGIRIPVAGLKGQCPRPLDDGGTIRETLVS